MSAAGLLGGCWRRGTACAPWDANKQVESCWSDAGELNPPEWALCGDAAYAGGTILTCAYQATLQAKDEQVWRPVIGIGGQNGYYFGNRLWRLRGLLDRWVGGVGLRRGRRDPLQIRVGDALDFWRVLSIEPRRRLTLMAEMKVPGEATFDLQIHPINGGRVELRLISRFLPRGLAGILYWYSLYPFHVMIFKGMLKAIARQTGEAITATPRRWRPPPPNRCRIFSEPP
jgi:hypothetical protein